MSEVIISKDIDTMIENIDFSVLKGKVGIKVHFGEKGCNTYLDPKIAKKVYDKVVSLGHEAALIESNVLYPGSRVNSTLHKKTAHEHGFNFAPIDILDGEKGDEFIEVKLDSGIAKHVKLGKGLEDYGSIIALTHFKGHAFAGYGGVFKNLGMGLGSRAGKLHMHANVKPFVNEEVCIACGKCFEGCNFGAITLDPKASIDSSKCTGCAMCIAVCPTHAVNIPWGSSSNEELQKKIVDYTRGIFELIPEENCIFINVANKITKECDCMGIYQEPIMDDIGILYSKDPVALDRACLDLAGKHFDAINRMKKNIMTDYAAEKGLGETEYSLIRK